MRRIKAILAVAAAIVMMVAVPAMADEGRDNADLKWQNASSTGQGSWATISEDPNTRTGWCVTTHRKGAVPAVC